MLPSMVLCIAGLGRILKNIVSETVGKRILAYASMLDDIEEQLNQEANGDDEFVRNRVSHLRSFQSKVQGVWNSPVIRRLLR